jgi:hypothetical protein
MALSPVPGRAGLEPEYVDAVERAAVMPRDGGLEIVESRIAREAEVPGVDQAHRREAVDTLSGARLRLNT